MKTLRCKCGDKIDLTTDGFQDCEGCEKCGTTYAGHPDFHKELQPHTWKIVYIMKIQESLKKINYETAFYF